MLYRDGRTEVVEGDKVLGDKLKGPVVRLLKDRVVVRVRGVFDPKGPSTDVLVERDPAELELLRRK